MSTSALSVRPAIGAAVRIFNAPLTLWCVGAVVLFALGQAAADPARFGTSFFDSDDATRMVQGREFIAGAPWFDTTLARLGAPEPLVSHWSRLIDLPIAALIVAFGLVLSPPNAELAARSVWPLMLLLPLLWLTARAAEERSGRTGALIALVLAVTCFSGLAQFGPGRIDHHNALNLAAVGGILLLAQSFSAPRTGLIAGALLGAGLAVGLEALLPTVSSLAMAGLLAAWTGRGREGVSNAAALFAATLLAAFLLTTAPSQWLDVRCDALSLNLVVLAGTAAAGLSAVLRFAGRAPLWVRLCALAAAGGAGIALYGSMEPACLAGPFGQVDPAVVPIWLDHVAETQSFLWLLENLPIVAAAALVHLAAGLGAAMLVLRQDRDDGALFYTGACLVTAALSLWQLKLVPYAALLALPPLAIAIGRMRGDGHVSPATSRAAAVVLVNQWTLLGLAALLLGSSNPATERTLKLSAARGACLAAESIAPLASLPNGLVAAEVDQGPFIAALTPLRVLSAPYHRLDKAILETHAILYASPEEAKRRLFALDATYVALCAGLATTKVQGTPPADALKPSLLAGHAPAFLEPVPLAADTPLKVWRVTRH